MDIDYEELISVENLLEKIMNNAEPDVSARCDAIIKYIPAPEVETRQPVPQR